MKDIFRFSITLTLVACLAAGSLSWINNKTRPLIEARQQRELKQRLSYVLPGADPTVIVPSSIDSTIYIGYKDTTKSQVVGYASVVTPKGYGGSIRILFGVDPHGQILSFRVLSHKETIDIDGFYLENDAWRASISKKKASEIKLIKDGGTIESETGATITARAIVDGIRQGAELLSRKLNNNNNLEEEIRSVLIPLNPVRIASSPDMKNVYEALGGTDGSRPLGYAFIAKSQGYCSEIETLVGMDVQGRILDIRILAQNETAGLGARCTERLADEKDPWWLKQFLGQPASTINLVSEGGTIESISGATITSKAIIQSIADKSRTILTGSENLDR
jgi:electron transport complex protein RnfG